MWAYFPWGVRTRLAVTECKLSFMPGEYKIWSVNKFKNKGKVREIDLNKYIIIGQKTTKNSFFTIPKSRAFPSQRTKHWLVFLSFSSPFFYDEQEQFILSMGHFLFFLFFFFIPGCWICESELKLKKSAFFLVSKKANECKNIF